MPPSSEKQTRRKLRRVRRPKGFDAAIARTYLAASVIKRRGGGTIVMYHSCCHSFSIHPEFNFLWKRFGADLTHTQLLDLGQRALSDPHYDISMSVFEDLRHLKTVDFDYDRVRCLGTGVALHFAGSPVTVKAAHYAPGDLAFGMARMFQTVFSEIENLDFAVFRDFDAAMAFLDLPPQARALLESGAPGSATAH